ncbi:MAG: glycosyltransferase family 61 protein [Pseudotabrizicola sp.]|uniref:glycosyltransferase family 61 protein n=1 Tax=Pseudotabrizicola sp. TaxID=2939647 RepID=UPI00271A545E|nr:glycosyltransferase family 61 protein [Pseudotabrizicola sp.]MDO8884646.1 glycosyltransferase family 61 protein [Pseudotabrizicola sp.]MDP2083377.1 glycosyltransferase family 61 protein [Pseudotabrizicola sp.]MDZ7574915.1 glycosyltransferase family 61 protein [Pseudotabrizicola sp.]
MRNQIDHEAEAGALFLDPARDPGIGFLAAPAFWWRLRDPAVIEGFAASGDAGMNARIEAHVRQVKRHRTFARVAEFNVVPVLLQGAAFRRSYATVGGKALLNGAAGARLLNRYNWDRVGEDSEAALSRYFAGCQVANEGAALPLVVAPEDLDFALECRNTFNFFHFLTETLPQLCVLDAMTFRGRVFLHFPNHPDKTRAFVLAFIEALFPELAGRVVLERTPKDYAQVLSAFSFQWTYFQMPPSVIGSLDGLAPSGLSWHGHSGTRTTRAMVSMNSVESSLPALRERALRAIEGLDFSHLPKRVYIARAPGLARDRKMLGEAALVELLEAFGFVRLAFEDLTPLEQIALMARAEVVVSAHGAGFANMLFANPDATMIEIATLQTAQIRWGDFWPVAHASGCRYVSFIADHHSDAPLEVPDFNTAGIVPAHLTERGLGRVMAFIAALCGHVPRLNRAEDVARLAGQLLRSGHLDRAGAVLDRHHDMQADHADLCLAQAELHKARAEWGAELVALYGARQADPSRWQILAQVLWCARRLNKTEVQVWAIRLLQAEFPDRIAELSKGRDWVRQLL